MRGADTVHHEQYISQRTQQAAAFSLTERRMFATVYKLSAPKRLREKVPCNHCANSCDWHSGSDNGQPIISFRRNGSWSAAGGHKAARGEVRRSCRPLAASADCLNRGLCSSCRDPYWSPVFPAVSPIQPWDAFPSLFAACSPRHAKRRRLPWPGNARHCPEPRLVRPERPRPFGREPTGNDCGPGQVRPPNAAAWLPGPRYEPRPRRRACRTSLDCASVINDDGVIIPPAVDDPFSRNRGRHSVARNNRRSSNGSSRAG